MKAEFNDFEFGIEIVLKPETIEEATSLIRYGLNANSEKPDVYVSVRKELYCDIWLKKRKPSVQKYSIKSNNK